ncbi:MAG: ABC transporter substrate-binding protein [Candidatus Contendobacter odensis]|uniref:ABC transporter substrate-binding protein n=1 Tax=Candidatus Contendibacter odensensis TaxID=1400860 RepID=A0A2G6PGG9_9GAMM|nr:MAG: ABC transporter substrate-binding protein [Candidatus Contendobacter odensis]
MLMVVLGLVGGIAAADPGYAGAKPVKIEAAHYPVTVQICDRPVRFDARPQRVVTHDVNITELFLALDLGHLLVGYSGVRADKELAPEYRDQVANVPLLSQRGMDLESIVGTGADFVFAGWSYGFTDSSGVTPEALARLGIGSYVLTESCIRVGPRARVSLEDTFTDLLNLGRIFGVSSRAEALVEGYRRELAEITDALRGIKRRPRVFVYDSGTNTPLTAGRYAMPNAMIEMAGGINIFDNVDSSWVNVNWEDVIDRDPELIVIVDYGQPDASGKISFLNQKPELAEVAAIQSQRFLVLTYAEATPGPHNVARTRTLAQALHPERFR